MSKITTEWDNDEHTIMRVTYHPNWTWDDMEANTKVEEEFMNTVNHKTDTIADFRGTRLPPGAIGRLPKIAKSPSYMHENSGEVIMVGSPAFMSEVVAVYKRVYGQAARLTMVSNLDEARAMIAEKRAAREKDEARSE